MIRVLTVLTVLLPSPALAESLHVPPDFQVASVKERFAPIQHLSFAAGLEYCGYLGTDPSGHLAFTEMVRGDRNGCTPPDLPNGFTPIASMHTHGAYDATVPAEFPTVLDMEADRNEGVNGYVATPGGRLWYIDSEAMETYQLCGLGCLPQDPGFHAGDDGVIAQSYTYQELEALEFTH
ncbi:MAG: DUF4329 domain-containing protein [Ruegeria sp.]